VDAVATRCEGEACGCAASRAQFAERG
jgi:hypothetical protein